MRISLCNIAVHEPDSYGGTQEIPGLHVRACSADWRTRSTSGDEKANVRDPRATISARGRLDFNSQKESQSLAL